jgi:signal transduction histidine kinase
MGFSTIRERLKELNSHFTSSSKKGEGTFIQIEISLDEMSKRNGDNNF